MAVTVETVEAAITDIMTNGQSASVDGINYSNANINALIALRDKLRSETATTTRPLFRAFGFGSMGYD